MDIKISEDNGKKYVYFIGNLDGNSSNEAASKVTALVDEGVKLVINMTECTYVSSAGLRALLMIGKTVKMKGGSMKFENLCDEVADVMKMTGFAEIFKDFEQ